MDNIIFYYFLAINIFTFAIYAIDKYKSTHNKWRIPEKRLVLFAGIGGSLGALLGMLVTRHKIRKPKFYITVPIFLILHILIGVYYVLHLLTV